MRYDLVKTFIFNVYTSFAYLPLRLGESKYFRQLWEIKTFVCSELVETKIIFSFAAVTYYYASVSTKDIFKYANQEHYKLHNNNTINPSAKLTQTMCVNLYIVQPH